MNEEAFSKCPDIFVLGTSPLPGNFTRVPQFASICLRRLKLFLPGRRFKLLLPWKRPYEVNGVHNDITIVQFFRYMKFKRYDKTSQTL